jgi:Dolichyl-phosphate-mannose-protein mannosyltransferase
MWLGAEAVEPEQPNPGGGVRTWRRSVVLWFALILALLISSRAILAPKYLVTFDEVNFALSLKEFNPVKHQPQPPGYPLFVGLLRLFAVFIPRVEQLFLVLALVGSALSLALLWATGDRLLGRPKGLVAALLLLFHPAFWFAALTNPVRIYLAVGATAVALCLIQALSNARHRERWYYAAAAAYALAGGFRPDLLLTLSPLMIYTSWRLRVSGKQILLALIAFLIPATVWLTALVSSIGGIRPFLLLLHSYGEQQGASTSPLLGAPLNAWLGMAYRAGIWTFWGSLSWLWCVPLVWRKRRSILSRRQFEFLVVWLVPAFLFYVFAHVGDPDHPLSAIPVTCLAGAAVLTSFTAGLPSFWRPLFVAAAVALNALLFLHPLNKAAKAASYDTALSWDNYMQQLIETVQALNGTGRLTVVFPAFVSGWRTVSYYFPDVTVLVLESSPPENPGGTRWQGNRRFPLAVKDGKVELPSCGVVAWVDPTSRPSVEGTSAAIPSTSGTPVTCTQLRPGISFRFRNYPFQADPAPACAASSARF